MHTWLTQRPACCRLNIEPRPAMNAFLSGFYELIEPEWVAMFTGEELQALIGGSQERLDMQDMRRHVEYAGRREHASMHHGGVHDARLCSRWDACACVYEKGTYTFVTNCTRNCVVAEVRTGG